MISNLKKLIHSDFAKNIAWLTGGTAISQAITILASVVITRLYSDEDFGVFTLYVSILSVLLIVSSLKLEQAIPITSKPRSTMNLVALNFMILLMTSIILLIISLFFSKLISDWLDVPKIEKYIFLIPIGVFFGGSYSILYQWALKEKVFKLITRTKITQGVGLSIGKIGIGLIKATPFGLIFGHIIGKSSGVFSLARIFYRKNKDNFNLISKHGMSSMFHRFKQFPLLTLPAQLLSTGGLQLPVFLITAHYGVDTVGQFGLSEMIVGLPVVLIGTAVGDVFYAEVAENGKRNPEKILRLSNKLILKLIALGVFPMVVLLFFGPFLFTFVFGENWQLAGELAQVLGVLAFFRLVFTPVSRVYILYERHLAELLFNMFRITVVVASFGIAKIFDLEVINAVIIYAVGMSIVYFFIYLYAQLIIKQQIKIGTK